MKKFEFLLEFAAILFLVSVVAHLKQIRFYPHQKGVNPILTPYVDRWLGLAKNNGLEFKNTVNIGFKKVTIDGAVGLCYYGSKFREIEIDPEYWNRISYISKTVLVWHELSHCYCKRDHDYDKDKVYPTPKEIESQGKKIEGYYKDKCPLSLMYPIVVDELCFVMHSDDYAREQFQRCEPY